ncbi:tungsten formylmethanofuran dehydrogenase [Tamlana nanhaiensis]|uniref:Tungsten formylmethanofuran dehydrogenase n=1 Tax=Neotamlana nanhaiensis TaxID=1382798 RepID=A0A0D7W0J6_9FLAO|nr:tungsten formylmethanofuran dehydrogenase [Tamlana nanhaiensis]KJD31347.1 tungsten formylmethanofuran dehydrogenase [Tamlana nanhaiensis]
MKKILFKKDINAPAAKVYTTMLGLDNIETYNQWTAAFNPTSTYEGTWEKGSKMLFVGTDENGKKGGMISEIAENIPNQFISIRHYGILDGDNEITEGPNVEQWAGGLENYAFSENNGITTVTIETDTIEDYQDYFNTTWPKALDKLKAISEE